MRLPDQVGQRAPLPNRAVTSCGRYYKFPTDAPVHFSHFAASSTSCLPCRGFGVGQHATKIDSEKIFSRGVSSQSFGGFWRSEGPALVRDNACKRIVSTKE